MLESIIVLIAICLIAEIKPINRYVKVVSDRIWHSIQDAALRAPRSKNFDNDD